MDHLDDAFKIYHIRFYQSAAIILTNEGTHHVDMKFWKMACCCSSKYGNKIELKSLRVSWASVISRTYSLCTWWSFRQAFWYFSRTSSNFLPLWPTEKFWVRLKFEKKKKTNNLRRATRFRRVELHWTEITAVQNFQRLQMCTYIRSTVFQIEISIIGNLPGTCNSHSFFWSLLLTAT